MVVASLGWSQDPNSGAFAVASVKHSDRQIGPDYNNKVAFSPTGVTGKNITLQWLVAAAYGVQQTQVRGPNWIDREEYELATRAADPAPRAVLNLMLQSLLEHRFELKQHQETREMRVHKLVTDRSGLKIQPTKEGDAANETGGHRFHGDMRQFADFLAVQLSIPAANDPTKPAIGGGPMVPVLDRTGLTGTFDIDAGIKLELGTDLFTLWRRALPERLGLRLETGRDHVPVIVIDSASKIPTPN